MPNGHITERDQALGFIDDADETDAAELVIASLRRLGHHGRSVSERIVRAIENGKDRLDADLVEGLAQIEAVEGVLSGRTDSL